MQPYTTRSRWIEDIFCNPTQILYLLQWLATKHNDVFQPFARHRGAGVVLLTVESQALRMYVRLTERQFFGLAGFFRTRHNIKLENKPKELRLLQSISGTMPIPKFGLFKYNSPKHGLNVCKYWTISLVDETERVVDELLDTMIREDEPLLPFDYKSPVSTDSPGINVLFGGDHGDIAFRHHMKLQLSSPQIRKERRLLSYRCPEVQIGFIQCRKDAYEVLVNTIVKPIRRSLQELRTSSLIVVHSTRQRGVVKSIMCPKTVDPEQLQFEQAANGRWSMRFGSFIKDLPPMFDMMCTKEEIRCYRAISSFNEFHIGDLEFLANQAGMKNSSSKWCIFCQTKGKDWGKGETVQTDTRTKENHRSSLHLYQTKKFMGMMNKLGHTKLKSEYKDDYGKRLTEGFRIKLVENAKPRTKKNSEEEIDQACKNHNGVNQVLLFDIDPQRVLIPTLHAPMGLCNKLIPSMTAWLQLHAEPLDAREHEIRKIYLDAMKEEKEAEQAVLQKIQGATKRKKEAMSCRMGSTKQYTAMQNARKLTKGGLAWQLDLIYQNFGAEMEHYHGGALDGGSNRALMGKTTNVFLATIQYLEGIHDDKEGSGMEFHAIRAKVKKYENALALLDVV